MRRIEFNFRGGGRAFRRACGKIPPGGWIAMWAAGLIGTALCIPLLLVDDVPVRQYHSAGQLAQTAPKEKTEIGRETEMEIEVRVYVKKENAIETVALNDYVRGVVAAEMPADFELEALKAQAIAARTYIVRRLAAGDRSGVPVEGADITDTVAHQAYISQKGAAPGTADSAGQDRIGRAVAETGDTIMTYRNEPIEAVFFSTSNGYTENSEDYWQQKIPYLRSVSSPWDKSLAPNYEETVTMPVSDFLQKLNLDSAAVPAFGNKAGGKGAIRVLERTKGRRIKQIQIGGQSFSGREVREKLGLRSSHFTWSIDGANIRITTYGNGHGVGMSQWGANGMAKEGKTAQQILQHYYTGIQFEKASNILRNGSK